MKGKISGWNSETNEIIIHLEDVPKTLQLNCEVNIE